MSEVVELVSPKQWTSTSKSLHIYGMGQLLRGPLLAKFPEKVVRKRTIHLPKIEIMGIPFLVNKEDDGVILESERWPSLRSSGPKVQDAIEEMRSLLHDVIEEYVLCPEENLSDDAKELRHYLISTLI